MYEYPTDGRKAYQVGIYNREVRALVKDNESHAYYNDLWADAQYQEVVASDEREARTIVAERFPAEDGFVIADLFEDERA